MSGSATRPNIVVLFSDQQRWDTVGACGSPLQLTPNLDRLATDGAAFSRCFTPQPVCGPARACLMTGQWATRTGVWRNDIALAPDALTLPRLLKPAGYDLAYIGKWHLASDDGFASADRPAANFHTDPVPRDRRGGWTGHWIAADALEHTSHAYGGHMFDSAGHTVAWEGYRADALTNLALEYLGNRKPGGAPFCLFVSYLEPHHQNDSERFEGPRGSADRFRDLWAPTDLTRADARGDWREQWPDYLGCVASLDMNAGRILTALERRGLLDNTLVVYTSDHGCHFKTRNWEYKRSCHDASTRVPCIIRGPGFRGGLSCGAIVTLLDISATIVQAARVPVPDDWPGRPLQRLAARPEARWRNEAFIQISEATCGRALRTLRWTYAVEDPEESTGMLQPASAQYREAFLYDNMHDPHQLQNRIADPALDTVRRQLRSQLLQAIADAEDTRPAILEYAG